MAGDAGTVKVAEGEGFEPPLPFDKPVFKTGAFSRSANPPRVGDLFSAGVTLPSPL